MRIRAIAGTQQPLRACKSDVAQLWPHCVFTTPLTTKAERLSIRGSAAGRPTQLTLGGRHSDGERQVRAEGVGGVEAGGADGGGDAGEQADGEGDGGAGRRAPATGTSTSQPWLRA